MAGNIKGITIEFSGDTTQLDRSLKDIDKSTRNIDSELKKVNNSLKFNPTSVELWRQKQDLLKQKIQETGDRLKVLKQQQAQMDAKGVDKNSKEYRNLQREIISTESKLKTFKGQLRAVGNVNLRAASEQMKAFGTKATQAGQAMRGFSRAGQVVVAALGALTYKSAKSADDLNTMAKQYSLSTVELQKYKAAADLVDVSVEDVAKSHVKLTKNMLMASEGSEKQAAAFKQLGIDVTNSDGSLRDADTVWQETIAALGEMTNETERDAIAMRLMGGAAKNLNPLIEDGGKTYKNVADTLKKYGLDFVDEETLQNANQFKDELDTIKAVGSVAFMQIGTQLAAYLAPAMEKIVEYVGQFAQWLGSLDPEIVATVGAIAAVIGVLSPLLIIIGQIAFAISSIISFISTIGPAISGLGAVIAGLSGPIGWVIAAIAAAIAIGILLYKNWDKIKAKANDIKKAVVKAWNDMKNKVRSAINGIKAVAVSIWSAIKTAVVSRVNALRNAVTNAFSNIRARALAIFNAVKTAITHPIQTAVGIVKAAISKIRSILSGKISLPHIKLPHFSITGKFSLDPPSIPKISVSWYKTGGIFNSPTVAGIGEAGPEAVIPLDTLWKKLDKIAAASSGGGNTINVYGAQGQSVKELANEIQRVLVQQQKQRLKVWGY